MPVNNGLGINSFSGPLGQKEAAYGTSERMKVLSRIGVKPTPGANAAQRSKRKATRQSSAPAAPQPLPAEIAGEQAPVASYDQQLAQFWQIVAQQPGASPLVQQIAAQVAIV